MQFPSIPDEPAWDRSCISEKPNDDPSPETPAFIPFGPSRTARALE